MTTERSCQIMSLAAALFMPGATFRLLDGGKIAVTGTTRSGEPGTMIINSGGAFAFEGNPDDMIAATLEAAGRDPHARVRPRK